MSLLTALFVTIFNWIFRRKSTGDKAIEQVIRDRENTLKEVAHAKRIRENLASDPAIDVRVRKSKYQRD